MRRVSELGPLLPTDISVVGTSFRESGTDVAIAGLGWIGVAVDGAVELRCLQEIRHVRETCKTYLLCQAAGAFCSGVRMDAGLVRAHMIVLRDIVALISSEGYTVVEMPD